MRGGKFHNKIVGDAKSIFSNNGWQTYTEHRYRRNGITTYLDLLAVKEGHRIGCEVETTIRHAVDNTIKAQSAGIMLWIIVPSRKLYRQIKQKLSCSGTAINRNSVRILLLSQLESELKHFSKEIF